MLQTPSPPSATAGEVVDLVRSSEGLTSASLGHLQRRLPQSKTRRNYTCAKCTFHTRNSRAFLWHAREVHFEKIKIFECPYCVYACRHYQKLVRHLKVHNDQTLSLEQPQIRMELDDEDSMRIEDYLEEVEECDDDQMELEECSEELLEHSADVEADIERVDEATTADSSKKKNSMQHFMCNKCNYVTHIRGRYTKHVKYHSMPMIKCTMCDFRTPYKWNLDRHNKNHGGTGSFHCSMCNFTADIKQSLTVHEMNHHTQTAGHSGACRRRNRVGASDSAIAATATFVPKEDEGSGDSRSSHSASDMGLQNVDRDLVSNSDSNDATSMDSLAKREDLHLAQDGQIRQSPNIMADEAKNQKQNRKPPRPPPPLIPLNASTPNQKSSEPLAKKIKVSMSDSDTNSISKFDNLPADITLIPVSTTNTKDAGSRKKNFFDKLKERLLTETGEDGSLTCKNCGFESKCLSEHSVHEKNCTPISNRVTANASVSSLSSTRCQNCRHRCKSSADLLIHMQTCKKSEQIDTDLDLHNQDSDDVVLVTQDKEAEPHPMENVVFVWNNIGHDANKFELPLDININDDSTLPEQQRHYDAEVVDENDGMNLSPSQAAGKKVFKCPHCPFWASTASRFHVHIVGHLNKKPFECSLCKYKSNWRWDITKHIKLKSARDPEHNEAKVLMTDETGRRNYSKYNKFLAMPVPNENGENEFHYIDPNTMLDSGMEMDESLNDTNDSMQAMFEMQPLNLQTQHGEHKYDSTDGRGDDPKKTKKTLWKCKKCNYKDPSKEALLEHVREHSRLDGNLEDIKKRLEITPDPPDLAYRCGHCNQLSNWKHVIQRHCRLKHDGIIKVITTVKPKPETPPASATSDPAALADACPKCPFRSSCRNTLLAHLQGHEPSPLSIFKCYFCPYFVKDEQELIHHLVLHGITDPEEYIAKTLDGKTAEDGSVKTKRHKCTECPYETNSKSQYMYHDQFHRLPADTPYKCPECNYSVSKRHLLHQHLRVHGIFPKKSEMEAELEASSSFKMDMKSDFSVPLEIPFVWVSAKNEFHKMYKCRYCSYVNSQKCKIPNHEKIHCIVFENTDILIYKCLECKFTCDSAGRLSEHSKTHAEIYGRIYCPVEEDVPDDEQIAKLRKVIENEKLSLADDAIKDEGLIDYKEMRILHFCHKCPARFFTDSELKIHDRFHDLSFDNKCKSCEFSVPLENDLTAHIFVHSDEYHTKTKMLKFVHSIHPAHKEPIIEVVHCPTTSEMTWIVSNPSKNFEDVIKKTSETKSASKQYCCKECPAKFFKSSALSYHMGLHGGDGEHKCKKCTYAVKNVGNLAKHELLHESEGKTSNCEYDSGDDADYKNIPLSGTDLFQRKTEAQKRVLTDKDKLVKPNDHFPPVLQADPQFGYLMHGNPEFIYPTYLKNGRQKEKRYKCHKCPSAFEKREQYKIHLSLHGSKQRYKCELCDYSVKYYANYVQHMRKHQMNDEALAERKKCCTEFIETDSQEDKQDDGSENIKLAIKTMPKGIPKSDFQQFSVSDQQTLRLLQRRRSMNTGKEINVSDSSPGKDRKLHMCLLCPYTNQRLDALNNHYRRHEDQDPSHNLGNQKCSYCDLVVVQSHFLRDHLKTHFSYQKNLKPECYVANEDVSFTITKIDDENVSTDLKIDVKSKIYPCNENKLFVKINTGELIVE